MQPAHATGRGGVSRFHFPSLTIITVASMVLLCGTSMCGCTQGKKDCCQSEESGTGDVPRQWTIACEYLRARDPNVRYHGIVALGNTRGIVPWTILKNQLFVDQNGKNRRQIIKLLSANSELERAYFPALREELRGWLGALIERERVSRQSELGPLFEEQEM